MRYSIKKLIEQGFILDSIDNKTKNILHKKFKTIISIGLELGDSIDKFQDKALGKTLEVIYSMNLNRDNLCIDEKQLYDDILKFLRELWNSDSDSEICGGEGCFKPIDKMLDIFVKVIIANRQPF